MTLTVRQAKPEDLRTAAALASGVWSASPDELEAALSPMLTDPECAVFLAEADGVPVGFAQCGLRHDYVEGTESSPVGYLEGVFVREDFRRRGIAALLLSECERWAWAHGCTEFASDCEETNEDSIRFHLAHGFTEANRIVCFVKKRTTE